MRFQVLKGTLSKESIRINFKSPSQLWIFWDVLILNFKGQSKNNCNPASAFPSKTLCSWNMPMHMSLCTMHLASRSPNPLAQWANTQAKSKEHPSQLDTATGSKGQIPPRILSPRTIWIRLSTWNEEMPTSLSKSINRLLTAWHSYLPSSDSYCGWTALLLEIWITPAQ